MCAVLAAPLSEPIRAIVQGERRTLSVDERMKETNLEAPLVLVVDDYLDAREMCAEFLRFSGYRVEEAVDGIDAIEKATELLPAVILMDLSLPRLDGLEATRRLKKEDRTKAIPVIALTGHALAGQADIANGAGCDSFLSKPCLPDVMVAEVRRLLAAGAPSRSAGRTNKR